MELTEVIHLDKKTHVRGKTSLELSKIFAKKSLKLGCINIHALPNPGRTPEKILNPRAEEPSKPIRG